MSLSVKSLKPFDRRSAKIKPLGPRDIFDNGIQIDAVNLSYKFTVAKAAEYTFHFPQLSEYLYESPIDVTAHVYQDNKYLFQTCPYPERYSQKLEKGNHRIIVQLRHEDDSLLEKLKDLPVELRWKLSSAISLDCYSTHEEAFKGDGNKSSKFSMNSGRHIRVFFAPIPEDK